MLARVAGGTGAGQRMHRNGTVPKAGWVCPHGHRNPGYAATCLAFGCRERRPKEPARG